MKKHHSPLIVLVIVRDKDDHPIEQFTVNFSTHEGRRRIADTAHRVMPLGFKLITQKVKTEDRHGTQV